MSGQLFEITTFVYLFASFWYLAHTIFRNRWCGWCGTAVTVVGVLVNGAGIAWRWLESYSMGFGYVPLANMYESLVFLALAIGILYLGVELLFKTRLMGVFSVPLAFAVMAYASLATEFGKEIKPLLPALQSNWLVVHVVTCFIGYAALTIAVGIAVLLLTKPLHGILAGEAEADGKHRGSLDLKRLEAILHRMMVFGFIWLTAGIVSGAVWANSAWGTYWSWDPKETWSLITWFVYALALHLRFTREWSGNRLAWMAIVGFISTVFTYYGVNFLLSGLHSYGG